MHAFLQATEGGGGSEQPEEIEDGGEDEDNEEAAAEMEAMRALGLPVAFRTKT